jgi:signal peptidase I
MTDETGSGHYQSAGSASDDEIGDELALEHGVTGSADVAPGLPTAASPRQRPRHSRPRGTDFNLPPFAPLPSDHPTDRYGVAGGVNAADDGDSGRPRRSDRHTKKRKPRRKAPWWELPLLVAVAIVIAVVVKTFVVQPFYIPSESMEKTLHGSPQFGHDRILVNKTIYDIRDPHPGDIVVFHAPPGWDEETATKPPSNPLLRVVRGFGQLVGFVPPDGLVLVKRVIAVGGQTVKGVTVDGGAKDQIMISDHGAAGPWRTLDEPYVYLSAHDTTGTFGPVTVPKGRLWVMGDHRNDSADSRYHCPGTIGPAVICDPTSSTVPVKDVIGKAVVVAWPPSHWRTLGTPSTFKHAASAALPTAAGMVAVVPLWFLRRRKRSRPDA